MEADNKRRKFLNKGFLGMLSLGVLPAIASENDRIKVKCLTREGKLVEIEVDREEAENARTAQEHEVKDWVHKSIDKPELS